MPLNIDLQEILLHALNLTILFVVLFFLLYKPVKRFMEKRRKEYEEIDEKTRETLDSAEKTRLEYENKVQSFKSEIVKMRAENELNIEEQKKKKLAEAESEAENILNEARRKAAAEREKILSEAKNEIVGMVTEAVEKVTHKEEMSGVYDDFFKSAEKKEDSE